MEMRCKCNHFCMVGACSGFIRQMIGLGGLLTKNLKTKVLSFHWVYILCISISQVWSDQFYSPVLFCCHDGKKDNIDSLPENYKLVFLIQNHTVGCVHSTSSSVKAKWSPRDGRLTVSIKKMVVLWRPCGWGLGVFSVWGAKQICLPVRWSCWAGLFLPKLCWEDVITALLLLTVQTLWECEGTTDPHAKPPPPPQPFSFSQHAMRWAPSPCPQVLWDVGMICLGVCCCVSWLAEPVSCSL